jgi:hypothetical protein
MTQAFDQAWSVIARNISQDASEAARARLAEALLSVAAEDSRDVKALKRKALEAMASAITPSRPIFLVQRTPIARMLDSSSPEKKTGRRNWAPHMDPYQNAPKLASKEEQENAEGDLE